MTITRKKLLKVFEKELFFIVGTPKSGTTWLQAMLDSHPSIVCKGEGHYVDMFYLELSRQLDKYNKTVAVQGGIVAHLKQYGGHVETLKYRMEDANYLLTLTIAMMMSKWAHQENIVAIGEKTPDNITYMTLLGAIFPQARFVHILRDPRDCAISRWHFHQSVIDANKTMKYDFDLHVLNYATYWNEAVVQGRESGMNLGDRYMEIYYESLLTETRPQLQKVTSFIGVKGSDSLQECIDRNSFENMSHGRKPGQADNKAFVRKGVIGDWKQHFSDSLNDKFLEIAGKSMSRFGFK